MCNRQQQQQQKTVTGMQLLLSIRQTTENKTPTATIATITTTITTEETARSSQLSRSKQYVETLKR
ncbi:hypothetical protein GQ42DRAFT_164564 [Ramicandelaber brevisporus]|nr:hypothetical protein GQ42DRAFT_164564 [Ramicandelaber brevisporus]